MRRRRRLRRPANAPPPRRTSLRPPLFSSEKMKKGGERRELLSLEREERERKEKMRGNGSCHPYIPLLTRPRIHRSNRPKPKSIGPTRAPCSSFSPFIFCTPLNTCCTPLCIHSFFYSLVSLIFFHAFFPHFILLHLIFI